jgi:hypothetical protein
VSLAPDDLVGKTGRVTSSGEVRPGRIGEVILDIRGGTEAFCAHPSDGEEVISPHSRIVVVEADNRTVYVTRLH